MPCVHAYMISMFMHMLMKMYGMLVCWLDAIRFGQWRSCLICEATLLPRLVWPGFPGAPVVLSKNSLKESKSIR